MIICIPLKNCIKQQSNKAIIMQVASACHKSRYNNMKSHNMSTPRIKFSTYKYVYLVS